MDSSTTAVQHPPGLSEIHTVRFSSWNIIWKKDAREHFEFWRSKYHPETDEQMRRGSRYHTTPVSPTALCSQNKASPELNL